MSRMIGLVLIMMLGLSVVRAQDAAVWYPAYTASGDVVLYSLNGEVSSALITEVDDTVNINGRAWRLADDSLIVIVAVDGKPGLYHLTPDKSALLTNLTAFPTLVGRSDPYLVYSYPLGGDTVPAMLINTVTDTVTYLSGELNTGNGSLTVPFSADGKYLRYFSTEDKLSGQWRLIERKLETGDERIIYELSLRQWPSVSHDLYGELWFVQAFRTSYFIRTDGFAQVFEENSNDPSKRVFYDQYLLTYSPLCGDICILQWQNIVTGELQYYRTNEFQPQFRVISNPGENSLLITSDSQYWLLESDYRTLPLGRSEYLDFSFDRMGIISPDGSYIVTSYYPDNNFARYRLIDLINQAVVTVFDIDADLDPNMRLFFGEYGIIAEEGTPRSWFYDYEDGSLTNITEAGRFYFATPDEDRLLFRQTDADTNVVSIGIYDFAADTSTTLLENATPIETIVPPPYITALRGNS